MAFTFDYDTTQIEYNGGASAFDKISVTSYVAPTTYADFTDMGATDGVTLEFTTDQEGVRSDQADGEIDVFRKATGATMKISIMESTLTNLLIAMGMDYSDTTNVLTSGNTEFSWLQSSDVLTTARANFGALGANVYFQVRWAKKRSHEDKEFGFVLYKCTPTGNMTFAGKHEEKNFFDVEFKCLSSNLAAAHAGNIGYFYDEA